jgi:PAS domain S-box-containing protein
MGFRPDDLPVTIEWLLRTTVHPADAAAVRSAIAAAVDPRGDGRLRCEFRITRDGGDERWVLWAGRTLFEIQGDARRPARVIGTVQDLTARRRSEEALRQSDALHRALADATADFIWQTDINGVCLFVNRAWREYTGMTLDDYNRVGPAGICHPEDLPAAQAEWQKALATSSIFEARFRYRRHDGAYRWFLVRAAPVRENDGRVARWVGVSTDVHQMLEAESALRDREAYFRGVGEAVPGFLWVAGPDGKIEYINQRWADYTGVRQEDFSGRDPNLMHPDDAQRVDAEWRARFAAGEPMEITFRYRRFDGTYRWFLGRAVPVRDADGHIARYVGVSFDINDAKTAEERLAAAKHEADAANAAKDRFLAVLSHELRTPLTPVVIGLSMLEMHPDLPGDMRQDLAMLRRNIELETRLIDDLLDITRIANGKLRLSPRAVSGNELAREAIDICQSDARARRLELVVSYATGVDSLHGDPARLQQVFWNLLKNAIKFTPPGGRVDVRTFNPSPGEFAFEVTDTGVGIDPAAMPRLFNAFEQGEQGVTRQFGGLGLGLAISRALTQLHAGRIEVFSDGPGTGARFVVTLPLGDAPRTVATPTPTTEIPSAPPMTPPTDQPLARVLLVDDHDDTLQIMRRMLERFGCAVTPAGSGHAALEAARAATFDLVISDIGLPDLAGHELMRELRSRYGLRGVAISGCGMDSDLRASRDAGFDAHLVKPVNMDDLANAIAKLAGRSRQ